ncbi:MAG TPA: FIST N-terminal domain-containing protein, partial [Hyphomicrobium sp.]
MASSLPTREAVAAVRAELAGDILQHIIVFFSIDRDPGVLLEALKQDFPETHVSGCSTSGEIGPLGMMQGGMVFIAFPEAGFRMMSEVIPDIDKGGVERASEIARRLRIQMIGGASRSAKEHIFALVLIDGLSNAEEALTAAINLSLDGIELVGGSAGDGLVFENTVLIHRGKPIRRGAILFVIETAHPVRIFRTQNFEPTQVKLVVTAADTENRIVYELNAEPAAREYAAAIGLRLEDLGPHSFASYPFVVKIGGNYYCRCIRSVNPDGSLSFFCAIDEGLVFTVARPRDMLRTTLEA